MSDLLLAGGYVIDPGGGHIGRYDVAVAHGRVAAVAPDLPRDAREVVDVTGKLVTPGLVDMHTHVHPAATYWGIDPDPIAWHTGVTTWVDAGSCGAYTLSSLPRHSVRVPALLNISAIGLTGAFGESMDLANCDVDLAIQAAQAENIFGIKVRMDRYNATSIEPLRRAVEAASAHGLPVMVHIGAPPPPAAEWVPLLRKGDIITHCASGMGTDQEALKAAHQAGVWFDLGHGAGGLAFDVLEAQLEAGMPPHTISSDLHARSLYGPVFDLPTTMAKLLAVGFTVEQVIEATTIRPAQVLGLDAGTLAVGVPADIAVFEIDKGRFELVDTLGQRRLATQRLRNLATFVAGKPLPAKVPGPPPPWIRLTPAQREVLDGREKALRDLLTPPAGEPQSRTSLPPARPD